MASEIRDLTADWNMPADAHAGIFEHEDRYAVAWGHGYDAMTDGGCWDATNDAEHGVEWFDFESDAREYSDRPERR